MSLFTAADVVVGGGGSGPTPSSGRIMQWVNNQSYSDGQAVLFNGSQYIALGSPGVGLIPAIEVATPQTPGQPRWALAARGRSTSMAFDDMTTYYADQVVTYLGGVFILEAATVPMGTRPNRDKRWLRLSETLTDAESEKVSTADLSGFSPQTSSVIFSNGDEDARVRHHWVRLTIIGGVGAAQIYSLKFPRSIPTQARPHISVQQTDVATALMLLSPIANVSGNQVIGYTMTVENAAPAGTWEFLVTVKEQIDQVHIP